MNSQKILQLFLSLFLSAFPIKLNTFILIFWSKLFLISPSIFGNKKCFFDEGKSVSENKKKKKKWASGEKLFLRIDNIACFSNSQVLKVYWKLENWGAFESSLICHSLLLFLSYFSVIYDVNYSISCCVHCVSFDIQIKPVLMSEN